MADSLLRRPATRPLNISYLLHVPSQLLQRRPGACVVVLGPDQVESFALDYLVEIEARLAR